MQIYFIFVNKKMKKVFISGQSGFIGTHLSNILKAKGYEVVAVDRRAFKMNAADFLSFMEGADIVINLAGAPIIKRWTKAYKNELIASRIFTTRKLAQAIDYLEKKPLLFISVSAVGIYDDKGIKTEQSDIYGHNFLSKLCIDWEAEATLTDARTQVAVCRMGIVIGENGGAMKSLLPFFKMGLGGKIGNGSQMLSWIQIEDVINAFMYIIEGNVGGTFNFTAPQPVTNKAFTKALAAVLNKPAFLPIPTFALRLIYGEGASVLTGGQDVRPKNLEDIGYKFTYPDIDSALTCIIHKKQTKRCI